MPPIDDHEFDSLDPNEEWVLYIHNHAGQCFGICCIPPIPPAGEPVYDGTGLNGLGSHTNVQPAIHVQPGYEQYLCPATEAGTRSLHHNLNPNAPPFFVPPNTPQIGNSRHGTDIGYHDLQKQAEQYITPDNLRAQTSVAARLASKPASEGTGAHHQRRDDSNSGAGDQVARSSVSINSNGLRCPDPDCTSKAQPFKTQGALNKHMRSHEPKENLPYHCDVCDFHCRCPRELARHSIKHEPADEKKTRFSCPYCGRPFGRSDNRKRHILKVHPELPFPPVPLGPVTPPKTAASSGITTSYEQEFPSPPTPTPPRSITHG